MDDLEPITKPIQAVEPLPNLPENYIERVALLIGDAEFPNRMFDHIANGGTLITLADMWRVKYSDVSRHVMYNHRIKKRYDEAVVARGEWEIERLCQELRAIATVDIREAYKADGTLKDMRDIPAHVAAAISSVESEELFTGSGDEREMVGYTKKVKFWDKAKSIELFMKKHGLLVERHRHEVGAKLEDLVHMANADSVEIVDAQVVEDKKTEQLPEATPVPREKVSENHSA